MRFSKVFLTFLIIGILFYDIVLADTTAVLRPIADGNNEQRAMPLIAILK